MDNGLIATGHIEMPIAINISKRSSVEIETFIQLHDPGWREATSTISEKNLDRVSSSILRDDIGLPVFVQIHKPKLWLVKVDRSIRGQACARCLEPAVANPNKDVNVFVSRILACLPAVKNAVSIHVAKRHRGMLNTEIRLFTARCSKTTTAISKSNIRIPTRAGSGDKVKMGIPIQVEETNIAHSTTNVHKRSRDKSRGLCIRPRDPGNR